MHTILIYGFPLILLLFEWGLRSVISVDAWGFVGPTLATAGLSFLVPLTRPKEIAVEIPGMPKAVVTSKADNHFIAVVWLVLLLYLFLWEGSCYLSIRHPTYTTWGMTTHFLLGLGAYMLSLVLTLIKEKV